MEGRQLYNSDICEKYTKRKGIFEFSESKQQSKIKNEKSYNEVQAALELPGYTENFFINLSISDKNKDNLYMQHGNKVID